MKARLISSLDDQFPVSGSIDRHARVLKTPSSAHCSVLIENSPLAAESGWVDVDPESLRHVRFPNVYGDRGLLESADLEDRCRDPETGARARGAPPGDNRGRSVVRCLQRLYLMPARDWLRLARDCEFDYDKNPEETFPVDQSKERWSMWFVKKTGLPWLYWNLLLKGLA